MSSAVQKVPNRVGYNSVDSYQELWKKTSAAEKDHDTDSSNRKEKYTTLVNTYYDLATDFYEWGWGTSFHFAPRRNGESVPASIARHEHYLALRLKLERGMKVLDVGCGVGGPMMEIARFSGATVIGINNNEYQISRGERHVKNAGLEDIASFIKGDFMNLPFPDGYFDAVYGIEAICHAPDKVGIYTELMRVLKPGGLFACYEWALTDRYDASNPVHRKAKEDIEVGDGLPDIDTCTHIVDSLEKTGYKILDSRDVADVTPHNPIPWYDPFQPSYMSVNGIRVTTLGIAITHNSLNILEKIKLVPTGTTRTHSVLMRARDGLLRGGLDRFFTPMFFFLAQKPTDNKKK